MSSNLTLKTSTYKVNSNTIEKALEHCIVLSELSQAFPLPFRKSCLVVPQYTVDFKNQGKTFQGCVSSKGGYLRNKTPGFLLC
jgi:hypothetical protein